MQKKDSFEDYEWLDLVLVTEENVYVKRKMWKIEKKCFETTIQKVEMCKEKQKCWKMEKKKEKGKEREWVEERWRKWNGRIKAKMESFIRLEMILGMITFRHIFLGLFIFCFITLNLPTLHTLKVYLDQTWVLKLKCLFFKELKKSTRLCPFSFSKSYPFESFACFGQILNS